MNFQKAVEHPKELWRTRSFKHAGISVGKLEEVPKMLDAGYETCANWSFSVQFDLLSIQRRFGSASEKDCICSEQWPGPCSFEILKTRGHQVCGACHTDHTYRLSFPLSLKEHIFHTRLNCTSSSIFSLQSSQYMHVLRNIRKS